VNTAANCFYSPNYPGNYDLSSTCSILVLASAVLDVVAFETESSLDTLKVNGVYYSGQSNYYGAYYDFGPNMVSVETGTAIAWISDSSLVYSGFKICATNVTNTSGLANIITGTSLNESTVTAIILSSLGGVLALAACCICVFFHIQNVLRVRRQQLPERSQPAAPAFQPVTESRITRSDWNRSTEMTECVVVEAANAPHPPSAPPEEEGMPNDFLVVAAEVVDEDATPSWLQDRHAVHNALVLSVEPGGSSNDSGVIREQTH
jgi:hypothetical protein